MRNLILFVSAREFCFFFWKGFKSMVLFGYGYFEARYTFVIPASFQIPGTLFYESLHVTEC